MEHAHVLLPVRHQECSSDKSFLTKQSENIFLFPEKLSRSQVILSDQTSSAFFGLKKRSSRKARLHLILICSLFSESAGSVESIKLMKELKEWLQWESEDQMAH